MADSTDRSRGSADGQQGLSERNTPPEHLFRLAWEEINSRMSRLRQELEQSEKNGLGDETREELVRKLVSLQQTVDAFAERWMDFERKRKTLEEKLEKEP
jgi:hypothetical protein